MARLLLRTHSATHNHAGLIEPVPYLPDEMLLERDPELVVLGQRLASALLRYALATRPEVVCC